jgi:hypothetical protein
MNSPFVVRPREIEQLTDMQLVELCNALIWEDGRRAHIPLDRMKTTARLTDADGGIDAFTDNPGAPGRFVESGSMVWQFKRRWPTPKRLEEDVMRGTAAREQFAKGAGYTMVVGGGVATNKQIARQEELEAVAQKAGCKANVRLLVADDVARWATGAPGVLFLMRPAVANLVRADFMLASPQHSVPFEGDIQRTATIDAIERTLLGAEPTTQSARIVGAAGVGKTRLSLEVIRASGLEGAALYGQAASVEFFNWIAANDDVQATLIVDECDDADARRYEMLASQSSGRLRLLTVGHGAPTGDNVYFIDPLDEKSMERVLKTAAPSLTDSQTTWVAEKTRGYVKLAVPVALSIAKGATNIAEMSTERNVQEVILRLVVAKDDERHALRGLALLTRVGWQGDVEVEGRAVADFVGVPWNRMQMMVADMQRDGMVVAKGRYRYVSPELLAQWLAAETWRDQSHRIRELLDALPDEGSRTACMERLAQLGSVPGVRDALEEVVGSDSPFRDVDDLDNERMSRLFAIVSQGAPEASLRKLNTLTSHATHERLLAFKSGRREVVWSLARLVERRETFFDAARVLLALAEAENEYYGNNATGVFNSLFLTFLGPTEVPLPERFIIIEEALESASTARQVIALNALGPALRDGEMGLPMGNQSGVPRPNWRPQTWGDVWDVKRQAFDLLVRGLTHDVTEVRRAARDVFREHARSMIHFKLDDEVSSWFERIGGDDEAENRKIWEAIMSVLKYEADELTPEQTEKLERAAGRFFGESLTDRIKRYSGKFSHVDWPGEDEDKPRPEEVAASLADEALHQIDTVRPILRWLFSGEAEAVGPFAYRLGFIDESRAWFETLLDAAKEGTDPRMLSLYIEGRARAGDEEWKDSLLDAWADDPALFDLSVDATARGAPGDRGAARIVRLVDEGRLSASSLSWFTWGRWANEISARHLLEIVERMLADASLVALDTALTLIDDRIGHEEDGSPERAALDDLAWRLLEQPNTWVQHQMVPYHAGRVAKRLLDKDPERLAHLIVRMYTDGEPLYRDDRLGLLPNALNAKPREVWAIVGDALLNNSSFRFMLAMEQGGIVEAADADIVIEWVEQHGVEAAKVVAHAVKPDGEQLSKTVRFLVTHYRKEVAEELAGNIWSGMWWGSEVDYLADKIRMAGGWKDDPEPEIRRWVQDVIGWLKDMQSKAQFREEENELR